MLQPPRTRQVDIMALHAVELGGSDGLLPAKQQGRVDGVGHHGLVGVVV